MTRKRPRLRTLAPRVPMLADRIKPLSTLTRRLRGRGWVKRRGRWLREHPLCQYCQEKSPPRISEALEIDHREPLWKGGRDDETNYASSCLECHKAKTEGKTLSAKDAFHKDCKGCHDDAKKAKKPAGPTGCTQCHVKDKK